MNKLIFDTGVKEYQINENGVLRFNPNDPNVYARFMDAVKKIQNIEESLVAEGDTVLADAEGNSGEAVLQLMAKADKEVKKLLTEVFGKENDFDAFLGGVNLLAVASNGERVLTNLFEALTPILTEGARNCAEHQVSTAVDEAKTDRAQRRAAASK